MKLFEFHTLRDHADILAVVVLIAALCTPLSVVTTRVLSAAHLAPRVQVATYSAWVVQ
jgi:hypothetical protein